MALNDFFRFMTGKKAKTGQHHSEEEFICKELAEAAQDYYLRELAFWTCVNIVATALGRCEFKTFIAGKEVRDFEYYLWNYQPNQNENSTMFWHKFVSRLYQDNEVIIVNASPNDERNLLIADSYAIDDTDPSRPNKYTDIQIGNRTIKTLYERDVMRVKLNHHNLYPVLNGLFDSYTRLISTAVKAYNRNMGPHWKVHVNQMAQGQEGWIDTFNEMIEKQVRPFFESNSAVLPEFDGYTYSDTNTGKTEETRDIKALFEDVFEFTARGLLIPPVLTAGKVESTEDANRRFLTNCIDPLADQLQEEGTRKRYGFEGWKNGDYLQIDTSSIIHFDIFDAAAAIEKVVGSGVFSINDIRKACGQARIEEPWADEHFMTLNISKLGAAAQPVDKEGG